MKPIKNIRTSEEVLNKMNEIILSNKDYVLFEQLKCELQVALSREMTDAASKNLKITEKNLKVAKLGLLIAVIALLISITK